MTDRFRIHITHPGDSFADDRELGADQNPADRCMPTVEINHPSEERNVYRSRCLGCGHRGPERDDENAASEDAHDHAFPGWRDLPIVPSPPSFATGTQKQYEERMAAWLAKVRPLLPEGWFERGGPIRTHRKPPADRHVPLRLGSSYDMATGDVPDFLPYDVEQKPRLVEPTGPGEQLELGLGI